MHPSQIRQWIRNGDTIKLDQVVLEGQGHKLLGEYSPDNKIRTYLKTIPTFMSKIDLAHDAVSSNSLSELQSLLQEDGGKRKLFMCKDQAGVGLLHKAVYYDLPEIVHYLIENYPNLLHLKDRDGRIPLHYVASSKNPKQMINLLVNAGSDSSAVDSKNHTYQYYIEHPSDLELPTSQKIITALGVQRKLKYPTDGLVIKPSNIRIWIHQKDLIKLQQVLWEGHGSKLRTETSNNPKVKKFLDAVPHLMGLIKEIHSAVVNDNIDVLKEKTADPTVPIILTSKDGNGLTPLHKAAGLNRMEIAEYIVERCPKTISITDSDGRIPLHYAATLKDDSAMYDFLVGAGSDEAQLDNKQKTAAFYKTRSLDMDSKLLQSVPDAPRTAQSAFPPSWDWGLLSSEILSNGVSKIVKKISSEVNSPTESMKSENEKTSEKEDDPKPEAKPVLDDEKAEEPKEEEIEKKDEETSGEQAEPETNQEDNETVENKGGSDAEEKVEVQNENPESSGDVPQETKEEAMEEIETDNITNEETQPEEENKPQEDVPEEAEVIEGVVNGENEVEPVNNDGNKGGTDQEVIEMIESGNMEQLAALVLNGEGERLIGQQCSNPELQAFLDNVQSYMDKINRVHVAARDGSLRDLQAALDRRKFAIAKDKISPNGASPLHVATIFGNTSIVRYLAGRFPETVQVEDDFGRTPLHYAATIADNGHYYNLLLHLGANAKTTDRLGHMAEYYRNNSDEMSHKSLLRDFGAEEQIADDMLSEKDSIQANPQVDIPLFRTEEGRYLASSLGDPLIKGLTEVANKRPKDPIQYLATYLHNFASSGSINNNNNNKPIQQVQGNHEMVVSGRGAGHANNEEPPPASIDVVAVEPDENSTVVSESAFSSPNRDEHGQSMLHFAAARSHGRNALFQLLEETEINIGYRDELYRTARDVSIQASIPENTAEIDRWVMHIAARGDTDKLVELLLEGYDHILDIVEEDGKSIVQVVEERDQPATVVFLQSILVFEEKRERVHHMIRIGDADQVRVLLADEDQTGSGNLLAIGKNNYGRCSLHIAVLCQREDIAAYIASAFPDTLRIGDNLERTALHYAMGVEKVESISKVLIKAGAKRVLKDLKGRQATYYFMNKSDILRLQEEEETF